ncbi:rRNA-processing protein FCF1 homolog [Diaphorina citri]|uniref:rRNA-processing protein FCF1 homolog n=1 Tax=Diaphorina citri TaxID=121845 RepID=A0A1S4E728_DIACI|nr:rRNA-processing protein FCF1 homolog [Diaphorina citri]
MGKQKKTRKIAQQRFAQMKKMIKPTDSRIKEDKRVKIKKKEDPQELKIHNALYIVSLKNKLCVFIPGIPYITDCVLGEIEKLGQKYKVALRIIKDPRFERIPCMHKGTYADDCIVNRVTQHKCYIVATCDKDLKRRIRKVPGVPIMYISQHRYTIERMPDAYGAPK